jgi:hypothetical protein
VLGLTEILLSAGGTGVTVTPNVLLIPEKDAVRVAEVDVLTLPVLTENVAEVEPAGTVTEDGTLAAVVLELESDTETPPLPAAAVKLTVPVPDWPLTIVLGLTEILLSAGGTGLTVTPNVTLVPE